MLICQMTDLHLLNMVRLCADKIEQARSIIESGGYQSSRSDAILISAIAPRFSIKEVSDRAESVIKSYHAKLEGYVMEAMLRGMGEQVTPMLQRAYGRSQAIAYNTNILEEGDDDERELHQW